MSQFSGKTALVLGGTSGIGLATTHALLAGGATVHVVGRSAAKMADAPNLVKHVIDITDRSCLLYTSPSPRDLSTSRMPSSA